MAKGLSIHIGLNCIDPLHYGTAGTLPFCVNDAMEMKKIALREDYTVLCMLQDTEATSTNVRMALDKAAEILEPGDKLLLTYSGHGSYFPDLNGDEEDSYDESWILYDRMLIDDELYLMWSKFRGKVRILLVSDSCHSGTMAKPLSLGNSNERAIKRPAKNAVVEMLKSEAAKLYKAHKAVYDSHLKHIPSPREVEIRAGIILLASSGEDQLSMGKCRSGRELSLFTDELITVYEQGNPHLNYKAFLETIKRRIPAGYAQTPNYFTTGTEIKKFLQQRPFAI
jgi:regulator of RNase E activity RraB